MKPTPMNISAVPAPNGQKMAQPSPVEVDFLVDHLTM